MLVILVLNLTHLGRGNLSRGVAPSDWPVSMTWAFTWLLIDDGGSSPL